MSGPINVDVGECTHCRQHLARKPFSITQKVKVYFSGSPVFFVSDMVSALFSSSHPWHNVAMREPSLEEKMVLAFMLVV